MKTVWFFRWMLERKAEASRELWREYRRPGKKPDFSQEENNLLQWAMTKDVY